MKLQNVLKRLVDFAGFLCNAQVFTITREFYHKLYNSHDTSLLLSAIHIPWKTGGKTLVLFCFSFLFSLVSQKSLNSLQQFREVFRDWKVHILRSCYVTPSTYFSAPSSFVQEPGRDKSGWSCYQTFQHS